jgi:uncharacterized membrane protein
VADSSAGPLARLREAADRNEGTSRLADAVGGYLSAKAGSLVTGAAGRLGGAVERMAGGGHGGVLLESGKKIAQGKNPAGAVASAGLSGVKHKAKGLFGRLSGGSGGSGPKAINIVEDIDVGVPVRVAYNQWTRFPDFGSFTKGVQSVEKTDDTGSNWRAKVWWSTRSWKASVTEQVQDERIAWTTEAAKGTMKGVVTFHPLGENLTRVLLVVEYYPKGLFERTGNIWRAQGRRLRLDLKHYRRQVMMMAQADAAELDGWRGEIREGGVVLSHDDALALEEADLTDEQWAELEELDEDERAELAALDEDERAELAGPADADETGEADAVDAADEDADAEGGPVDEEEDVDRDEPPADEDDEDLEDVEDAEDADEFVDDEPEGEAADDEAVEEEPDEDDVEDEEYDDEPVEDEPAEQRR